MSMDGRTSNDGIAEPKLSIKLADLELALSEAIDNLDEAAYRVRVSLSKMTISEVNDRTIPDEYIADFRAKLQIVRDILVALEVVEQSLSASL